MGGIACGSTSAGFGHARMLASVAAARLLRGPRGRLAPGEASAVSTATTPATPSNSRTTFSAAPRRGSSSSARASRNGDGKIDAAVLDQDVGHEAQVDDIAIEIRALDAAKPLQNLLLRNGHRAPS